MHRECRLPKLQRVPKLLLRLLTSRALMADGALLCVIGHWVPSATRQANVYRLRLFRRDARAQPFRYDPLR
jgi:hypothetical protein